MSIFDLSGRTAVITGGNAGIGGGGRRAFIDRTEEEWRKMFATNLDGVFHVFQAAARAGSSNPSAQHAARLCADPSAV